MRIDINFNSFNLTFIYIIYIIMPPVKSKKLSTTKSKTKLKSKPKTKSNKQLTPNEQLKVVVPLMKCRIKKCKKEINEEGKLAKELYAAIGWNNKMTKLDETKRDNKKIKKVKVLQRENRKNIQKCLVKNCKKELNRLNKHSKKV